MAYQARGREPLFDSTTQAVIERRSKELIGIALVVVGMMAAAMIGSYTPNDPSFLSATDAPVENMMGRLGASIAAPLFLIFGWGSWAVAIVPLAWGLRFILHRGEERAMGRVIFAPIVVVLGAVYASTLLPGADWAHGFGLGGMLGDHVVGFLLNILPVSKTFGLKLVSLVMGAVILVAAAFVLGFVRSEIKWIANFLIVGLVVSYAQLMALLGRGAGGAVHAAKAAQHRRHERAEAARAHAEEQAAQELMAQEAAYAAQMAQSPDPQYSAPMHAVPTMAPDMEMAAPIPAAEEPRAGILSRMQGIVKRTNDTAMPEQELVDDHAVLDMGDIGGEDRLKAKISDVVKNRVRRSASVRVESAAPLTKGRGHGPKPLIVDTSQPAMRAEPPLTMPMAPVMETPVMEPVVAPVPPLASAPDAPMAEIPEEIATVSSIYDADEAPMIEEPLDQAPTPVYRMTPTAGASVPPTAAAPSIPVETPRKVVQHPARKAVQPSVRAKAEAQPTLAFEDTGDQGFELPPLGLLANPTDIQRHHLSDDALEANARMLENVLDDYGVKGEIVSVRPGPVVTMYELEPAPGLKASRVIGLADDIARSMAALSARVSTVPGRSVIGIELPNENREKVVLREILAARDFGDTNMELPLALGKDIGGDPVVANLTKMPHLLIAGTTGSGKSVAINTMILSLLYRLTPDECRLIMIDPKMLELSVYDGIPHLLSPVVTDPKKAVVALKWVVGEMEDRYRKMSKMGVRNIAGYNSRVEDALAKGETFSRTVQTGFDDDTGEPVFETEEITPEKMPYIVVVVDEMADLMMVAGKEIEACIQRLAQMARASGIHLIMATQRPSVDVITGTIKANFPTRISFQVTSKVDSRTILGEMGAEQLLGMGDMLYMAGGAKITRCHGPFVSDEEVEEIVNHLKSFGPPDYIGGVVDGPDDEKADNIDAVLGLGGNTTGEDALYDQAVAIVLKDRKCSTSYIQRKLAIGYNKAARLVEQMEDEGVVSSANHVGKREILVPEQ